MGASLASPLDPPMKEVVGSNHFTVMTNIFGHRIQLIQRKYLAKSSNW